MGSLTLAIHIDEYRKEYALYSEGKAVVCAHFDAIGGQYIVHISAGDEHEEGEVERMVYENSLAQVLDFAMESGLVKTGDDIKAVGIRIIVPGSYFSEHRIIDDVYRHRLSMMEAYAPYHIAPTLDEIDQLRTLLPHVTLYGISDSAFHRDMPFASHRYGISAYDAEEYDVFRFGYQGLAMTSVLRRMQNISGGWMPDKLVVCHLGRDSSMTAIKNGESVDTTMGFSPTSGLLMSSRSGDIDPGALLYLAEQKGMNVPQVREYLNTQSGLAGMAGSSELPDLMEKKYEGDEIAHHVTAMYFTRIKKYLGAYSALLEGAEAFVMTGPLAANPQIRNQACNKLESLGITVDKERNRELGEQEGYFNVEGCVGLAYVKSDILHEVAVAVHEFTPPSEVEDQRVREANHTVSPNGFVAFTDAIPDVTEPIPAEATHETILERSLTRIGRDTEHLSVQPVDRFDVRTVKLADERPAMSHGMNGKHVDRFDVRAVPTNVIENIESGPTPINITINQPKNVQVTGVQKQTTQNAKRIPINQKSAPPASRTRTRRSARTPKRITLKVQSED